MHTSLVITAAGVVSPYGMGAQVYCDGYGAGRDPLRQTDLIPPSRYRPGLAAQVPDYDPKSYLPIRGFRTMNRLTLHLLLAAEFLHQDLRFKDLEARRTYFQDQRVSIVVGTFGPLQSILDYDLQTIEEPKYVQPGLFPNAVYCVPAGYVAINKHIKASCITVTNGDTSSLDALHIGARQILNGRVDMAIWGGAEELTPGYALALGAIHRSLGQQCPVLAEGAALFSLETRDSAARRDSSVLGEVLALASAYSPDRLSAVKACLRRLGQTAGEGLEQVEHLYSNAGLEAADLGLRPSLAVTDLSRRFGYLGSLYGALSILSASADAAIPEGAAVLVLNLSREGNCSALLLRKGLGYGRRLH